MTDQATGGMTSAVGIDTIRDLGLGDYAISIHCRTFFAARISANTSS
jgi:hypothetical protein